MTQPPLPPTHAGSLDPVEMLLRYPAWVLTPPEAGRSPPLEEICAALPHGAWRAAVLRLDATLEHGLIAHVLQACTEPRSMDPRPEQGRQHTQTQARRRRLVVTLLGVGAKPPGTQILELEPDPLVQAMLAAAAAGQTTAAELTFVEGLLEAALADRVRRTRSGQRHRPWLKTVRWMAEHGRYWDSPLLGATVLDVLLALSQASEGGWLGGHAEDPLPPASCSRCAPMLLALAEMALPFEPSAPQQVLWRMALNQVGDWGDPSRSFEVQTALAALDREAFKHENNILAQGDHAFGAWVGHPSVFMRTLLHKKMMGWLVAPWGEFDLTSRWRKTMNVVEQAMLPADRTKQLPPRSKAGLGPEGRSPTTLWAWTVALTATRAVPHRLGHIDRQVFIALAVGKAVPALNPAWLDAGEVAQQQRWWAFHAVGFAGTPRGAAALGVLCTLGGRPGAPDHRLALARTLETLDPAELRTYTTTTAQGLQAIRLEASWRPASARAGASPRL